MPKKAFAKVKDTRPRIDRKKEQNEILAQRKALDDKLKALADSFNDDNEELASLIARGFVNNIKSIDNLFELNDDDLKKLGAFLADNIDTILNAFNNNTPLKTPKAKAVTPVAPSDREDVQ